jgi:hypothetical protein
LYRKERLFCWELPPPGRGIHRRNRTCQESLAHGQGILWKNGIPLRITGSWTRNPPEEWNSDGITGSWTWIQTDQIKNLHLVTISGTLTIKDLFRIRQNFKILNMKTSLK